jgi:hypothetical protein
MLKRCIVVLWQRLGYELRARASRQLSGRLPCTKSTVGIHDTASKWGTSHFFFNFFTKNFNKYSLNEEHKPFKYKRWHEHSRDVVLGVTHL